MSFVEITDPDKAMELYQAGLLWHKCMHGDHECEPAHGWYKDEYSGIRANVLRTAEGLTAAWRFYILLED